MRQTTFQANCDDDVDICLLRLAHLFLTN